MSTELLPFSPLRSFLEVNKSCCMLDCSVNFKSAGHKSQYLSNCFSVIRLIVSSHQPPTCNIGLPDSCTHWKWVIDFVHCGLPANQSGRSCKGRRIVSSRWFTDRRHVCTYSVHFEEQPARCVRQFVVSFTWGLSPTPRHLSSTNIFF